MARGPVRRGVRRDRRGQLGGRRRSCRASGRPRRAAVPGRRRARGRARRVARALLERRSTRPQPARDDKALAAWNGLAIAAFAEAGRLLGEARYTAAAVRAAETIVGGLLADDGSLQAVVEGRPRGRAGRARGLRAPRRGAARPVRDDVRRALVLARARPGRPDPGPVRGPGRRVLRHGRPITSGSSPGRRTRRTTRSRPAGRWPRRCSCGWPR